MDVRFDNYDTMPRAELIEELRVWEKKFDKEVEEKVSSVKDEFEIEKNNYKNLCYRKETEALDELKNDIAGDIKHFLNLGDGEQEIISYRVPSLPDEVKRQDKGFYGGVDVAKVWLLFA